MIVTEYRGVNAKKHSPLIIDYKWEEFCKKISHPVVMVGISQKDYDALPKDYSALPKDDNGNIISWDCKWGIKTKAGGAVFGEICLPSGITMGREDRFFPYRSAIVLDFENCGTDIFDRVKKALDGFAYCFHTTCNCRIPDDVRIHVIIPFKEAVAWDVHAVIAVDFIRKIGIQGFDSSCLRKSQMEMYCVQIRDNEYIHHVGEGEFLDGTKYLMDKYGTVDIVDLTEKMEINWKDFNLPELYRRCQPKREPLVTYVGKTKVVIREGDFVPNKAAVPGNVKSCFNHVFSCRDILDMLPSVYIPCGDRYTYYKGEGTGGVWVSNDGTMCGSHHSNSGDPLHGHSHTAFDVYILFFAPDGNFKQKVRMAHEFAKTNQKYVKLFYSFKIKI